MHRSGTSAITRGLKVLGVDLGERIAPGIAGNNDKGFWEDLDLNALNIEILDALGHDWHSNPSISSSEQMGQSLWQFRLRAIELLRSKIPGHAVWGLKDPRMPRLLAFWNDVFEHLGLDVGYIIAVRHPMSVARSLNRRDGFEAEKSHYLWLEHMVPSILESGGHRRVVVDYDLVMEQPEVQLLRIADRLGLSSKLNAGALEEYKDRFLDAGLRHTRFQPEDLRLDPTVPAGVIEAYDALRGMARDALSIDSPEVQATFIHLAQHLEGIAPAKRYMAILEGKVSGLKDDATARELKLEALDRVVVDRDAQINGLTQAVAGREGQIAGLNLVVSARDNQIAGLNHAVAARDGQIVALNQVVSERDGQVGRLGLIVTERDRQIEWLSEATTVRDGQIIRLNTTVAERDGQISALNQAVAERDRQVEWLNEATTQRDGQIIRLNTTLTERDGQVAGLTNLVGERDAQIAGLTGLVAERDARIAGLTSVVAERDAQIAGLTGLVAERDARIAGLTGLVAERDTQIAGLTSLVAERDAQIAGLTSLVAEREAQLAGRDDQIAGLNSEVVVLRAALSDQMNFSQGLQQSLTERQSKIDEILGSRSWRATKLLRLLGRVLRGEWDVVGALLRRYAGSESIAEQPVPLPAQPAAPVNIPEVAVSPVSPMPIPSPVEQLARKKLLLVAYYCPSRAHAGGLRILDLYSLIKARHPDVQLDIYTHCRPGIDWSTEDVERIFDNIYYSPCEELTPGGLLALQKSQPRYDVIDLQFHQSADHLEGFRCLGRKILFTPMESQTKALYVELKSLFSKGSHFSLRKAAVNIKLAAEEVVFSFKADAVVCVSRTDAAFLRTITGLRKVRHLDTGISGIEFADALTDGWPQANPAAKEKRLVYVAYFGSETNIVALKWYLEHVHPLVKARVPGYVLSVVGRGDLAPFQRYRDASVEFLGEVPSLAPHISRARVGIAPALGGSGFRGKVNQYAVYGVPSVVSPISAHGLAYRNSFNIFVAASPEEFARDCIQLLEDVDLNRVMGQRARETCLAKYTWESKLKAIRGIYDLDDAA